MYRHPLCYSDPDKEAVNDADREGNRSGDEKDVGFILEAGDDVRQPREHSDEKQATRNPTAEGNLLAIFRFHRYTFLVEA